MRVEQDAQGSLAPAGQFVSRQWLEKCACHPRTAFHRLAVLAILPAGLTAQQTPRKLFDRAQLSEESGQPQEAIKLYEQAVTQSKGNSDLAARALYQMGLAYEKTANPEAAKRAYERIRTQYPRETVVEAEIGEAGSVYGLFPCRTAARRRRSRQISEMESLRARSCHRRAYLYMRIFSGVGQLVVSKRGTNSSEEILSGVLPAWSPDGKSIAFLRTKDGTEDNFYPQSPVAALLVYTLDTRDERPYVPPRELGAAGGNPVWSHDGKCLLQVVQDSQGIRSLYRVDLKTGEFRQVATGISGNVAAVSSDDRIIYMISAPSGRRGAGSIASITAIDLSSGQQRDIVSLPRMGGLQAVLSSDDKTLYLEGCVEDCNGTDYGIVSVSVATGAREQILNLPPPFNASRTPTNSQRLSLSPNGRTLAFMTVSSSESGWQLHKIQVTGGGYRKLADLNRDARMSWSGDGSILFVMQDTPEPIHVPLEGNDPEVRSVVGCSLTLMAAMSVHRTVCTASKEEIVMLSYGLLKTYLHFWPTTHEARACPHVIGRAACGGRAQPASIGTSPPHACAIGESDDSRARRYHGHQL